MGDRSPSPGSGAGTAPGAAGRRRRSRTPARPAAARRGSCGRRGRSRPTGRGSRGRAPSGSSGGASRPCLKSPTRRRLPGIDEATSGMPSAMASSRAMLIPSSREGRTNRSASRSTRGRVGRRRRAARPRPRSPSRAIRRLQRGPLGPLADQGQPGPGMSRADARARRRSAVSSPFSGASRPTNDRARRGAPVGAALPGRRRGRGRRWAGRGSGPAS